jgi:hypothetical protein
MGFEKSAQESKYMMGFKTSAEDSKHLMGFKISPSNRHLQSTPHNVLQEFEIAFHNAG